MNRLAFALAAALLCACTSQIDAVPTPVVRAGSTSPAGVYYGTITPPASGESRNVTALIDEIGHVQIFAQDGSYVLAGAYLSTGNGGYTFTAHYFTLTAATPVIATMIISGTYDSQTGIVGAYQLSSGATGSGTVSLTYEPLIYETPSALSLLAGNWTIDDAFGNPEVSFSLDGDGNISGSTLAGSTTEACTYANGGSGAGVSTLDLDYNLYAVTLAESCTVPATTGGSPTTTSEVLNGLLTLVPKTTSTPEQLLIVTAAENASEARLFVLPAAN